LYVPVADIGKKGGCVFAATGKEGSQDGIILMQVPLLFFFSMNM